MTTTTLPATLAATRPGVLERMDTASNQAFAAARIRLAALYPRALALAWTELVRHAPGAIIRAPRTRLGGSAPAVTDLRRRV